MVTLATTVLLSCGSLGQTSCTERSKPCNARTERVGIEALVNNRARNAAAGDINRALFIARAESGGKRPLFGPVNQILNRCDRERV